MKHAHPRTVWFFAGWIFVIYGIVIFISGLYDLSHPADLPSVTTHASESIVWGIFQFVVGFIFVKVSSHLRRKQMAEDMKSV